MSVFIGRGVRHWPDGNSPAATWFCTAPVYRQTEYPVLLDLLDTLENLDPFRLKEAFGSLIPEKWEEIDNCLEAPIYRAITFSDTHSSESSADEIFVEKAIIRMISQVPESGVLLRDVHLYDPASMRMCRTVINEARARGFHLGIDSPVDHLRCSPLWELLDSAIHVPPPTINSGSDELRALAKKGLVLHALPLSMVGSLEFSESAFPAVLGANGEAFVDFRSCRDSVDTLPCLEELQKAYNAWNPERWGYIRRAFIGLRSGQIRTKPDQHRAVIRAFQVFSRYFLYRYLVHISASSEMGQGTALTKLPCLVGAARLATRVPVPDGFQQAERLYKEALTYPLDPAQRTQFSYELANLLAVQRTEDSLQRARRAYRQAFQSLSRVAGIGEALKLRLQLLNGLALVEYHQHDDRQAFRLEHRARLLAERAGEVYPTGRRVGVGTYQHEHREALE